MIAALLLTLPAASAPIDAAHVDIGAVASPSVAGYDVTWTAPKVYVEGRPFRTHVEITVNAKSEIPAWLFEPGAFSIDGKQVQDRKQKEKIEAGPGSELRVDLDIGPEIAASKAYGKHDFKLSFGGTSDAKPLDVRVFLAVEKGLNFIDEKKVATTDLANYYVLLDTNRGPMTVEFWPDVAPNHVRNFLDLAYSGFYDGTLFHRVGPGFMIQGGDPNTKDASKKAEWGTGEGPRKLKSEFNAKKHVRGVLSMARGDDVNSASCQFFVMDAPYPSLDGKYTAFGILLDGFDALDKIVNAPGTPLDAEKRTFRPNDPQKILSATVVRAPAKK